jgi:hypothetical protein
MAHVSERFKLSSSAILQLKKTPRGLYVKEVFLFILKKVTKLLQNGRKTGV